MLVTVMGVQNRTSPPALMLSIKPVNTINLCSVSFFERDTARTIFPGVTYATGRALLLYDERLSGAQGWPATFFGN